MLDPKPGDTVQAGNSQHQWTLGEIVTRGAWPAEVANLHDGKGNTKIHVPLHELFVIRQKEEA